VLLIALQAVCHQQVPPPQGTGLEEGQTKGVVQCKEGLLLAGLLSQLAGCKASAELQHELLQANCVVL